ncbi:MAG TPA: S8 family serine peptidase, partial [Anaerolineae bacterium]|nr:S8 family serine peptidase [Anaerolineae bacterium]
MLSFKSSFRVARCILIVGLTLGIIWPMPAVSQARPAIPPAGSMGAALPSSDPIGVLSPIVAATLVTPTIPVEKSGPIMPPQPIGPTAPPPPHTIHLKSGDIQPGAVDAPALNQLARSDGGRLHVLLQLDFIPREAAKAAYDQNGVKLLAYVPDYAWIASVPANNPAAALNLPGVTWVGPLAVNDKLDPAITKGEWGSWNLAPDGTAAVSVITYADEDVATTRALVEKHGGKITSEVIGIKLLMVEMPQQNIRALAAEEPIQWIEAAQPPLRAANDGIRQQIGVDTVQAPPYNLNGSGVDILIYDAGIVTPTHPDFAGRITVPDVASVSDHSTHVAGIAAGSGSLSASAGGTALQWRGMAPGANIVSYAYEWNGQGMLFYNNPGDIEADWAAAQNSYGADVGNASLGSNIYANYPLSCTLMGNYGVTENLIDQIVRGSNPVVGVGDKYIAVWANGNERGSGSSCGTYSTIAPPAGAKNPIQVGASNTNDNSMTSFSSWGPTDDGRIKPIVVAGGAQAGGDNGIKSTIPNMYYNATSRNCDGTGDDYCYPYDTMQGTSMASPAVAGSIALLLQHYRTVYNTTGNFWSSTAKVILMQTAHDYGNPGPDYQWGFGQVNIQAAVELISRRAFREDSVGQGGTDVFYLIVPTNTVPLQVSLAWDDFQATFNANPTLINNLDLELEAPSGTIWRPWILNPASPASNATRGVNSVDNEEQVTVPSPEIGTWIVRVKGTTVPQGPQDYSMACEGCKPLDAGVCQSKVATTAQLLPKLLESESGTFSGARQIILPEAITAGEQWQRSLEQPIGDRQLDNQAQFIEQARGQGDAAVVALRETLTGTARDRAMDDIVTAQQRLSEAAPPPPATRPIGEAEEQARLEAQRGVEIANRAQALTPFDDPNEGRTTPIESAPQQVNGPTADRTVGNGCTYATIASAISASNPGDRLLIEGGRTFTENVTINKNLTLQGGYNGCASGSTARTTVRGSSGIVVQITLAPTMTAALSNLNVTNGNGSQGGIRLEVGSGGLTLNQVDIYSNTAIYGGGLWIGSNAAVTGTNVNIYGNSATDYGGGVRLYGGRATFNYSNIYNNIAPLGAGVYGDQQDASAPVLNLPHSADVYNNHATTGGGLGGGVYLREGITSLADCSDIYGNTAINGGGAYLITSTLTMNGACSEIDSNSANANGGGVYAQGSTIVMQDQVELVYNTAGITTTANGGGAYLDDSALYSYRSAIYYNSTSYDGGGVFATNGSTVYLSLGGYPCAALYCSQLSHNIASTSIGYGGAIRADDSYVSLSNTFVENNTANLGGGLYLYNNAGAYAYSSLFARNDATSGTADGIRLNTASLSGANNTFAYNDASGAATGHAIDQAGTSATALSCSVMWGHASSLNVTDQNVTYSDIQGGYGNSTNLNIDPLFVASSSQDYHLQSTSPVIDRCPSGQTTDFENEPRPIARTITGSPYDMGADEVSGVDRVGVNGACSYGTIQQAVNAANDGDTIRVGAGVYFENVDITAGKVITIEGGYNNTCTSTGAGTTRIDGSAGYNTFNLYTGITKLRNLQVAWGSGTGGGVSADGNAQVTLDGVEVLNNHGDYGGGIWLNTGSAVTITNGSTVHDNTATSLGGGVRTWGKFFGYGTTSDTYNNCATDGGGFSVPGGQVYLDNADVVANQA